MQGVALLPAGRAQPAEAYAAPPLEGVLNPACPIGSQVDTRSRCGPAWVTSRAAPVRHPPWAPLARAGGDLDPSTTAEEVHQLFSSVGPCTISLRRAARRVGPGGPSCYAYVAYGSAEEAERAVSQLNRCRLNGRTLRVMHRLPPAALQGGGAACCVQLKVSGSALLSPCLDHEHEAAGRRQCL